MECQVRYQTQPSAYHSHSSGSFPSQPSHSSQSHWISSSVSLALFRAMAKKAGFPLRQLHCSVVRWFKVHPKKNVLMCFDGGFESSIPWHRSHRQSDQSWKLCQLSTRPLTACSLAFRMLQTCLGCQIKDALLQLPSVFLAFLVPTPPIATFLNQESDPSLGDCNFHLSSRWLHNMHNDIIMT